MTFTALAGRRMSALMVMLGAAAALGHAPFDLWPVSLIALAAVLGLTARDTAPMRVAGWLWLAGFGYFGVALHWIVEPFLVDAARHGWMAPFALVLLAGGMALFWGLAGWAAVRLCPRGLPRIWALAGCIWGGEMLRATLLTGFPWAHPGHVLIGSDWLVLSSVLGPNGLTALVLFTSAAAAYLGRRVRPVWGLGPIVPVVLAGLVPLSPSAPAAADDAPVVRLVQPNAPQHLKWQPQMIPVFFERGLTLTAAPPDPRLGPPDIVVWPETSLPDLLDRSDVVRAEISAAAGAATVLVGAQRYEALRPRNTMAVLDGDGRILSVYDKHHLVPFGEYLPFEDLMAGLGLFGLAAAPGGYEAGPGPAVVDLPDDLGRVFPMICYEAIFAGYIRDVPRPDWMAHLTNDAWFGGFSGPYQHLALARLRAAEQGIPVLRSANTGVSAVIDSRGGIVAETGLDEAAFLDARLPPALPPTLYARIGDGPVTLVVLLVTALACIRGRRGTALRVRA